MTSSVATANVNRVLPVDAVTNVCHITGVILQLVAQHVIAMRLAPFHYSVICSQENATAAKAWLKFLILKKPDEKLYSNF